MRLLSEADVAAIIDYDAAIASSAQAFVALSRNEVEIPPRTEIQGFEAEGVVMVMPGLVRERAFGLKLVANRKAPGRIAPLSVSMILLFDAVTLEPLGLVASDHFTDVRTAAGIAAATDALARPDARVHAVYGAGKLAGPSVRAVARVRPVETVRVVGRSPERLAALVEELRADETLAGCEIAAARDRDEAAATADIVTAVTSSDVPVFDGSVLRPGTHVNIGGAFKPTARELDDHVAARGVYFVDSADSCLSRAGDLVIPLASGVLDRERVRGEIGAVLAGRLAGRRSQEEITVFKSLGNAAQDLFLADRLLAEEGCGAAFDADGRG